MMDQHQRDMRRDAAKAFMESLNQLHETLQSDAVQPIHEVRKAPPQPANPPSLEFDLQTFEQAVADIEEFIENQQQSEPETK